MIWTDADILSWCNDLARFNPKSPKEQIEELLRYIRKDKMSKVDQAICRRALKLLDKASMVLV